MNTTGRGNSIGASQGKANNTGADGDVPVVRTAVGRLDKMNLLLSGGHRTGTLTAMRPGESPELFYVRTADRPGEYLVRIDPGLGSSILWAFIVHNPGDSYAAALARSLARQQEEARRRLDGQQ